MVSNPTAIAVPGRNSIVKTAIAFIAELSCLLATAIFVDCSAMF